MDYVFISCFHECKFIHALLSCQNFILINIKMHQNRFEVNFIKSNYSRSTFYKLIRNRTPLASAFYISNPPSYTNALAAQPSDPIQKNCPVAFLRLTAFISSATS